MGWAVYGPNPYMVNANPLTPCRVHIGWSCQELLPLFRIESHGLEYLQNKAMFVELMGQKGIKQLPPKEGILDHQEPNPKW